MLNATFWQIFKHSDHFVVQQRHFPPSPIFLELKDLFHFVKLNQIFLRVFFMIEDFQKGFMAIGIN